MKPIKEKIEAVRSHWYFWLFPVFALLISVWLFRDIMSQRGPEIRISFEDAASLQPEKTKVRFRGVPIGVVKKIAISEDTKSVIADIQLQKDASQFAVEGSKFWVVSPKFNFQGISGLETIIEGTYISVLPGKADGNFKDEFKGAMGSDTSDTAENSHLYYLETKNAESMNVNDIITFRGFNIGTVTKVSLSKNSQKVIVQISIQHKYGKLIRANTAFWRKIGIQAKLGLFGSSVKVNSLDSILHGGIEIFTPDNPGVIAEPGSRFTLLPGPPKDYEKWNPVLEFQ